MAPPSSILQHGNGPRTATVRVRGLTRTVSFWFGHNASVVSKEVGSVTPGERADAAIDAVTRAERKALAADIATVVVTGTGLIAAALFIEIMMGHTTNSLGVSVV